MTQTVWNLELALCSLYLQTGFCVYDLAQFKAAVPETELEFFPLHLYPQALSTRTARVVAMKLITSAIWITRLKLQGVFFFSKSNGSALVIQGNEKYREGTPPEFWSKYLVGNNSFFFSRNQDSILLSFLPKKHPVFIGHQYCPSSYDFHVREHFPCNCILTFFTLQVVLPFSYLK